MGYDTLRVKEETKARLIKRMKYGDSHDSIVSKLLDIADQYDQLQSKPNQVNGATIVKDEVSEAEEHWG